MVDSGRKAVEIRRLISKKSDIGTAMVVTLVRSRYRDCCDSFTCPNVKKSDIGTFMVVTLARMLRSPISGLL